MSPSQLPQSTTASRSTRIMSNALTTECTFGPDGRLATKIERGPSGSHTYAYTFDHKGHLLSVTRDNAFFEKYEYDFSGRRTRRECANGCTRDLTRGTFRYDDQGRLEKAGAPCFIYDVNGALARRVDRKNTIVYTYNGDTMLDSVTVGIYDTITYVYAEDNPICPVVRFRNGVLSTEYLWHDPLHLAAWVDYETELAYSFRYDASGRLDRLYLTRLSEDMASNRRIACGGRLPSLLCLMVADERKSNVRIDELLRPGEDTVELFCGCDQVGTPKVLTDAKGTLIKEIDYDSFGVIRKDSRPGLFLPIGFAGGLLDPDTHLVRFGWRDYDPSVGRFTAPDPLGDTGGDHDLYDYCADDPVTMHDPQGLMGKRPEGLPEKEDKRTIEGETIKMAKERLTPLPEVIGQLKRITGQTAIENTYVAALTADWLNRVLKGESDLKATRKLEQAYKKIDEGLEEGIPKIVDGLYRAVPKIVYGIGSLPEGIQKTFERRRKGKE